MAAEARAANPTPRSSHVSRPRFGRLRSCDLKAVGLDGQPFGVRRCILIKGLPRVRSGAVENLFAADLPSRRHAKVLKDVGRFARSMVTTPVTPRACPLRSITRLGDASATVEVKSSARRNSRLQDLNRSATTQRPRPQQWHERLRPARVAADPGVVPEGIMRTRLDDPSAPPSTAGAANVAAASSIPASPARHEFRSTIRPRPQSMKEMLTCNNIVHIAGMAFFA